MALARPRFNPSPCSSDVDPPPLSGSTNVTWTPIITCPADFPAPLVRLFNSDRPSAHSTAVRTCHLPARPSSRVQLDAHPALRNHTRHHRAAVPRHRPDSPRPPARPEPPSQAAPPPPDARRRTRATLHTLRAFFFSSDRSRSRSGLDKLAP